MNTVRRSPGRSRRHGFTMVEVSVVIVTITLLIVVMLPRLARAKPKVHRPSCVNNLRNVGLAARIFATDNDGTYPWQLSITDGGTKELLSDTWRVATHFQTLSNELSWSSVVCPEDKQRQRATSWASVTDANLSYFLGLDSNEEEPRSIMSGDRNLTLAGVELKPGLAILKPGAQLGFTGQMHQGAGNLLLGDGSVQELTPRQLNEALTNAFYAAEQKPIRLLIP